MTEQLNMDRRTFTKMSAALGGLAALGGAAAAGSQMFSSVEPALADSEEKIVWNHCAINCPGRCALKLHVKDDELVRVETYSLEDNDDIDTVEPRCCLRGRAYRAWVNHPDRINYPLKRVEGSKRGEGKYEQISWDEALTIIAENHHRIMQQYGPEAFYMNYCTGNYGMTARPWFRCLNALGGYLGFYGNYSLAQLTWITPYMFGSSVSAGSTISAARNANLVLMFGTSPVETRQGGAVSHHDYVAMREKTKAKIYVIDPRFNDSLSGHSDEWLPINPGTDSALVAGLSYELIKNNWIDLDFLHTYCVGYDEETLPDSAKGQHASYYEYIMGTGYDMIEKTPEWASKITGISVSKIKELAKEIGTMSPVFVDQGWGPQRRSHGEMNGLSICMIPILTGNIGLEGTSNGLREGSYSISLGSLADIPEKMGTAPCTKKISVFSMVDAIDRGHLMTEKADGVTGTTQLPYDIKFVINWAGNCVTNQNGDINWIHDVLVDETKCEFILGSDILLTDSMKYSDIILPDIFRLEQSSMIGTGGDDAYMFAGSEPYPLKFERKSAYDAAAAICKKCDELYPDFYMRDCTVNGETKKYSAYEIFTDGGKSQVDWQKQIYAKNCAANSELLPWDEAFKKGVITKKNPNGRTIVMEAFRKDPVTNPLKTPSGKIEIYSEKLATYIASHEFKEDDHVRPIPTYVKEWYGIETTTDEYPLVLTGFHYRGRLHSSWGDVAILKELNPQEVWINPVDAEARGISQGDTVRIKNDFGVVQVLAKVTPRVSPGVAAMSQGAWHDADMFNDAERVDKGGCINTLTTHRPSPFAKGNPQHTIICQISKVK